MNSVLHYIADDSLRGCPAWIAAFARRTAAWLACGSAGAVAQMQNGAMGSCAGGRE